VRQKNSERRLEKLVREDEDQDEARGIYEIFRPGEVLRTSRGPRKVERDEDAPLAREAEDEQDA
jgi:hypothetical protein